MKRCAATFTPPRPTAVGDETHCSLGIGHGGDHLEMDVTGYVFARWNDEGGYEVDEFPRQEHTLRRDGHPSVRFTGRRVARASSERKGCDIWTELTLYRPDSKDFRWVASVVGRSRRKGHFDKFAVHTVADDAALIVALGHGRLSQDIYRDANVENVEGLGTRPRSDDVPPT